MINVLIVDDVDFFRAKISMILSTMGGMVRVFDAGSVSDAIKVLEKNKIDLIFLDLDLTRYKEKGEENGLDIVRYLINNSIYMPSITILSGNINQSTIMEAYYLGINDIILKPISSPEVLLDRVYAVMYKNRNTV